MDQEVVSRMMLKDCEMCHRPIVEPFYLIVGDSMPIHDYCLRCATCTRLIDERETKKCFFRDGKFHCPECVVAISHQHQHHHHHHHGVVPNNSSHEECFHQLNDSTSKTSSSCCHKCMRVIENNQYFIRLEQHSVMYHLDCFRCAKCSCRIEPGCPYALVPNTNTPGTINRDEILCSNHYRSHSFSSMSIYHFDFQGY